MSEKIDERDRLTFWRGWYNQARKFPDEQRLAWYDAVLAYAFDGVEPKDPEGDLTLAIAAGAVEAVRATIEISRKRREIGSKGGAKRKQTQSKAVAKAEQSGSKRKANRNQEQDQEQDQDQDHNGNRSLVNATTATPARGRRKSPPTIEQFQAMAVKAGVPADFAEYLHGELTRCDWTAADGTYIANPIRYLKSAWNAEQKKIRAARADMGPLGLGPGIDIAR